MTHADLGSLLLRAIGSHNAAVSMLGKLSAADPAEAPFHALAGRICDRYHEAMDQLSGSEPDNFLAAVRALEDVVVMYAAGPYGLRAVPT